MNLENMAVEQHEGSERFPSQEEIRSVFETIVRGKEYKDVELPSNAEDVHAYVIEVIMEDGERWEYSYEKSAPGYIGPVASIHVATHDADGMPYGGQCVANYLHGTWQHIPHSHVALDPLIP